MVNMYCLKCKSKREVGGAQAVTMKNGRPAIHGVCPRVQRQGVSHRQGQGRRVSGIERPSEAAGFPSPPLTEGEKRTEALRESLSITIMAAPRNLPQMVT